VQSNVLPIMLSMGAYNCLQQSDCHSYWEFNQYTDWVFPLYELPFTGGSPASSRRVGSPSSPPSPPAPVPPAPAPPGRGVHGRHALQALPNGSEGRTAERESRFLRRGTPRESRSAWRS